jgi:hypothetical protein
MFVKASETTFPARFGTVTVLISCTIDGDTTVGVFYDEPAKLRTAYNDVEDQTYQIAIGGRHEFIGTVRLPWTTGAGVEEAVSMLGFSLPSSVIWTDHY